jgi:hypothetical protein
VHDDANAMNETPVDTQRPAFTKSQKQKSIARLCMFLAIPIVMVIFWSSFFLPLYFQTVTLKAGGEEVSATIIRLYTVFSSGKSTNTSCHAVYEFPVGPNLTAHGDDIISCDDYANLRVGTSIPVIYDPHNFGSSQANLHDRIHKSNEKFLWFGLAIYAIFFSMAGFFALIIRNVWKRATV